MRVALYARSSSDHSERRQSRTSFGFAANTRVDRRDDCQEWREPIPFVRLDA
jgi:hypothetical protein